MTIRRTMLDFPRNEAGLVDEFIGTAYDVVKGVYDNLDELQVLHDIVGNLPGLGEAAVEAAMPPVRSELAIAVAKANAWAEGTTPPNPADPNSKSAKSWAAEAEISVGKVNKTNVQYPFTFVAGISQYDVGVISGDPSANTSGLALWVEGAIEYDFTVNDAKRFTLNTPSDFEDGAKMRIIINARFDDIISNFTGLQTGFAAEFNASQLAREQAYADEKAVRTADYLNYLDGLKLEAPIAYGPFLNMVRPTQTVTFGGVLYRPRAEYIPFMTGTWVVDEAKFTVANDLSLREDLNAVGGAATVGAVMPNGTNGTVQTALNMLATREIRHSEFMKGGTVTATQAAKNALLAAIPSRGQVIFDVPFTLEATLYLPGDVSMVHEGGVCVITMSPTGVFDGGWAVIGNSLDMIDWVIPYPNIRGGRIGNFEFRNDSGTPNRRGILYFGSAEIGVIRSYKLNQTIKRPAPTNNNVYCDHFSVRRVYAEPVQGSEFQVDIRGLGDGLVIEDAHFPWNALNPNGGTPNGIYVSGALGGRIGECIGGNVTLFQCTVKVDTLHTEHSQLLAFNANVDVVSTVFGATDKIPIVTDGSGGHRYVLNVDKVQFLHTAGFLSWTGADILVHGNYEVNVTECYRKYSSNTNLALSHLHGITLAKEDGSPMVEWNKYSSLLSRKGTVLPGNLVLRNLLMTTGSPNTFPGITTASLDSACKWELSSGPRFYNEQVMLDAGRLIGRNSVNGERTASPTLTGSGVRLDQDYGSRNQLGTIRAYRGDATGVYNFYADVPLYNAGRLYDCGTSISSFPWIARTPGPIDVINSGMGDMSLRIEGDMAKVRALTIPTVGVWATGDAIKRQPQAVGQAKGWENTAGSTPTWTSTGNL